MSMDKVFSADSKPYVSPPVVLEQFLEDAFKTEQAMLDVVRVPAAFQVERLRNEGMTENDALLYPESINEDCRAAFRLAMEYNGFDQETVLDAINVIDDDLEEMLRVNPVDELDAVAPPPDSRLHTHKALVEFREQLTSTRAKGQYERRGKFYDYRAGELKRGYAVSNAPCHKDIVLTAHVCPPNLPKNVFKKQVGMKADVKFCLNGQMKLSKLRDKIFCTYDYFSNLHDFQDATNQNDYYLNRYPSSFIFIHDTFYIDKRNPKTQDISAPIREFMKNRDVDFPVAPKVADMHETKIIDLTIRLGQPYVYVHIGECEHLIVFTDLRLMHPSDCQELNDFPIFLADRTASPKCCVCRVNSPSFVVSESDRIPDFPAFMCTSCFNSFHYDGDKRIGDFKAFHYIDNSMFE